MRKFKFNLERLLRIREHEEHEWEIKLGKAVSDCVRIETDIKLRTSEIGRIIQSRGRVDGQEDLLFSMEMYKRRMKKELGELGEQLSRAEEHRDEIRTGFLEVSRRRKVLSKLKEKREQEYYRNQLKIEHNLIDEINNARAVARADL